MHPTLIREPFHRPRREKVDGWRIVAYKGFEGYVAKDERSVALPPRACSAASVGSIELVEVGMRIMLFV